MTVFIYWQFDRSYKSLEESHRMSNHLITLLQQQKIDLVSEYEKELAHFRKNLADRENLLNKMKQENEQLSKQVDLLNQMAELQSSVKELQGENKKIRKEVVQLQEIAEARFSTPEEGYALLKRYNAKVKSVKQRIRKLEAAAQREHDKMLARLGNNGYMVREGEITSMGAAGAPGRKNIHIDVRFVN